jgi:signal transduction histidine kinase
MDAATRLRIFEPFFSTKGTTGTGLGLWISREIAAKQGGRLRVRSCRATPGRRGGTVFTVFLRLDTSNAANAA